MNNFKSRIITGALIGITIIAAGLLGGLFFMILFLAVLVLAQIELFNLIEHIGFRPQKKTAIFATGAIFVANYMHAKGISTFQIHALYIPIVLGILLSELYRKSDTPFITAGVTLLGVLYIAIPFSVLNYFMFGGYSAEVFMPELLIGVFVMLWANDTGAYAVGSLIGKRPLFKRVSPNKSWEGSIGGMAFVLLAAYIMSIYFTIMPWFDWLIIGGIVAVFGSYGDLLESLFKRSVQVKDSGSILPGHGGVLDRFDSLLISAPMIFSYLILRDFSFIH